MTKLLFPALGMFTLGGGPFLIVGLLPEISSTIERSIAVTGQGVTVFGLTYLISAPLFSMIFANISAKRVLQLALVLFLFGNLITAVAESLPTFLLGRMLAGLGTGIFTPLCVSSAVQLVGNSAKGRVLSLMWGANSAGVVFGVPLGVYLSSVLNWQVSLLCLLVLGLVTLLGFLIQNVDFGVPPSSSWGSRLRLLRDKCALAVIAVTCGACLASLGLYSYVASIYEGSPHSLTVSLFAWGLGGFMGSSVVGFFVDRTQKPQAVMTFALFGLMLTLFAIPALKDQPYLGLVPLFLWGAFGWAITAPQQHVLFSLSEQQGSFLAALNSSAIGLGSSLGTALGGFAVASGVGPEELPHFAVMVLAVVAAGQIVLIRKFPKWRSALEETRHHC